MQIKKSPKVDLERRKMIFLQIGLVLALGICLVAFEWTTEEVSQSTLGDLSMQEDFEEEIESTFEEEKLDEIEPEMEEPEQVIEELIIIEDDRVVENIKINSEADEKTRTSTNIITTEDVDVVEEVEPIAFAVVEDKPIFPGGDAALMKFLADNTKYPEIAKENGIQGRVFIQFVIDKTGRVTKVQVAKGVDPYLDAEAKRVVALLPNWSPGKQRGKAVPVTFIVPINFKLY
ncbi:MAG: energy transducer TonB [Bacteroidales bacterium]|nr:energy transducer TonB [Bacteroidales bacterium]MDD4215985.1 energy transducer TonB [Bacteroidales bacterium]MDY0140824.1 energy transducer TonB [Bacteroidales bacterium]